MMASFPPSVHLRVEEKITLTCGRDGGLQNMEVLGMVTLRVADEKNGRIRLIINNNDGKGLQLQVGAPLPRAQITAAAAVRFIPPLPHRHTPMWTRSCSRPSL